MWLSDNVCPANFNSRPSARGDSTRIMCTTDTQISIHAPPRGATTAQSAFWSLSIFQFTPLREGRPYYNAQQTAMPISIHAPPRGATTATVIGGITAHFNSRPSARGDTGSWYWLAISCHISIHAPPRGATHGYRKSCIYPKDFNSRPSARGDAPMRRFVRWVIFQFTPLREGRRSAQYSAHFTANFNSRPSARGDAKKYVS